MLSTRWISANRLALVSTPNIACASGSAAIAAARSSGAWRVAAPAYAASQRPSARAASTAARSALRRAARARPFRQVSGLERPAIVARSVHYVQSFQGVEQLVSALLLHE